MGSKSNFKVEENVSIIPGNIYYKDLNGAYLWCNESQLRSIGLTSIDQIIGKTDFDLCEHAETAAKIRTVDLRIMTTGVAEVIGEKGVYGTLRYTMSHKAPLRDKDGKIIGLVGNSINMDLLQEEGK